MGRKKILILADVHIGKATVFRKTGIPIPEGSMDEDLRNIKDLLHKVKAEKCLIVGDLIHAKSGLSIEVKNKFSQWLDEIKCEVHLVLGNHDFSLVKSLPKEWPLHMHFDSLLIEPFFFSHFPTTQDSWFVWSGHLHPKIEVKNKRDRIVLRCFQIFSNLGILPAFSSFVGGTFVKKSDECAIYGIVGSSVQRI